MLAAGSTSRAASVRHPERWTSRQAIGSPTPQAAICRVPSRLAAGLRAAAETRRRSDVLSARRNPSPLARSQAMGNHSLARSLTHSLTHSPSLSPSSSRPGTSSPRESTCQCRDRKERAAPKGRQTIEHKRRSAAIADKPEGGHPFRPYLLATEEDVEYACAESQSGAHHPIHGKPGRWRGLGREQVCIRGVRHRSRVIVRVAIAAHTFEEMAKSRVAPVSCERAYDQAQDQAHRGDYDHRLAFAGPRLLGGPQRRGQSNAKPSQETRSEHIRDAPVLFWQGRGK